MTDGWKWHHHNKVHRMMKTCKHADKRKKLGRSSICQEELTERAILHQASLEINRHQAIASLCVVNME